jgi:chromosome segregation ATPase
MRRFDDEDLTGAEFRECDLSRARLVGVVMRDAEIDGLVTNLVANRVEVIDKRLHAARAADPARRQRKSLELALAKATTAITRMIEAFSEQLITIDELRTRMPDLRARETNLRNQINALDAQHADREHYLTLATDVQAFLATLHHRADTAAVEDRQRVLRLVVKRRPHRTREHHRPTPHPGRSPHRPRARHRRHGG